VLELSDRMLELLFGLSSSTIYVAVGVLCWAEAAFFLGFVTPGELAVAAGGALASRAQAEMGWLVASAVIGTLTGNATGYALGRRWGARILDSRLLQRLLGSPIRTAREFMARRGEWAIVLGRLTMPTRIVVPFLAGAARLPYRRFVLFDVPATVTWATGWTLLGFWLGGSWAALQEWAGAAAFLFLALFITAIVIRALAARIAANQARVRSAFGRLLDVTGTRWLARRLSRVVVWSGRRFDPRLAHGLSLTVGFLALIGAVAAIGLVLTQTRAARGLALIDFPVLEWMGATRTEDAIRISRVALTTFQWPEILFAAIPGILLLAWRAGILGALRVGTGLVGASAGAFLLDRFVLTGPVPHAEYPSVTVAVAAALMTHATAAAARKWGWGPSVATAATAFFLVCTVAMATLVAGWAAPSGIALGFAIGLGWATTLELPRFVRSAGSPRPSGPAAAGWSEAEAGPADGAAGPAEGPKGVPEAEPGSSDPWTGEPPRPPP